MGLNLFNTLSGKVEEFQPIEDKLVDRLAKRTWDTIGVQGLAAGIWRKTAEDVRRVFDSSLVIAPGGVRFTPARVGDVSGEWAEAMNAKAAGALLYLHGGGYCGHHGKRDFAAVAEMLAARPELVDTLITHRFPIEDAPEAFRVASDKTTGALRVVLEPNPA